MAPTTGDLRRGSAGSDACEPFGPVGEDPALAGLRTAIDRLVDDRPASGDGERVAALIRQLHRLQAVVDAASADFAASGEWAASGVRSAASWLAERCRVPKAAARRSVGLGKAAAELSLAADAWAAGDIGPAHMAALAAFRRPGTHQALRRDEGMLVDHARNLGYRAFRQLLAYWEQHVDPDGSEEAAEARRTRRHVRLSGSFDGSEVDHIVPWEAGGRTTQQNGRLLCRFHHRMRQGRPPPAPG